MLSLTPCSGKRPVQVDHATIPTAVFSQPKVGTVGLTEAQARAQFSHVDIYKTDFRPIKARCRPRHPRADGVRGRRHQQPRAGAVTSSATSAAEIVQAVAMAVRMGATKADFDATIALHPTAAEECDHAHGSASVSARAPDNGGEVPQRDS